MPFVMASMAGSTMPAEPQSNQFITSKLPEGVVPPTTIATAVTPIDTNQPSRFHGLLGVFGRGFFAKPINHSDEENYRYLLALDR